MFFAFLQIVYVPFHAFTLLCLPNESIFALLQCLKWILNASLINWINLTLVGFIFLHVYGRFDYVKRYSTANYKVKYFSSLRCLCTARNEWQQLSIFTAAKNKVKHSCNDVTGSSTMRWGPLNTPSQRITLNLNWSISFKRI